MGPRRRAVIAVGLVVLVALAGCTSGILGDSSGDNSATESLDDRSFPDGASDEGIENGSALAEAHTASLSKQGYEVELSVAYESESESGSTTYVVRRDSSSGELYQQTVREVDGEKRSVFVYANDTAAYQKRGTDDPSYDVNTDTTSDTTPNSVTNALKTLVTSGNWTNPTAVSNDGVALVEYDFGGVSKDSEFVEAEAVSNASGSLSVTEQGAVRQLTLNITREQDGTTSVAHYEYRVTSLGDVAVQQPEWVSAAADNAEQDGPTKVSNRVSVVAASGNVENGTVETVDVVLRRGAGSDDIDLSKATVQWIGPESATTLTAGDSTTKDSFTVEPLKDSDDSSPVLNAQSDRLKISMDASEIGSGLEPGDETQLTVTTQYGSETIYWLNVPEDFSGNSVVSL